ncbi:MAG: amidohydrolase family protein [Bacillota bacterium]
MITGTGSQIIKDGSLLIENNIIRQLFEDQKELKNYLKNNEVEVFDYSDNYLMPGMIDCHSHLSIIPGKGNQIEQLKRPGIENTLRSIPNLHKSLDSGVTTIRVMGEENYIDIEIKKAELRNDIVVPRILASGIGIVSVNGHGAAHTTCDGKEEIVKQIRKNFQKGADHIKLFLTGGISTPESTLNLATYSKKEVEIIVKEAYRAGSYAAAHVHGGIGMDIAIESNVRTLEHAAFIDESQLKKVIEKDLWIIGTFSILFHSEGIEKTDLNNSKIKKKVIEARKYIKDNFQKILESNVNFAVGTDSMHGLIKEELKFVKNLGLDNYQAIKTATSQAAKACRIDNKLGTLKKDKIADVLVIKNNPVNNLDNLDSILAIFKDGKKIRG